MVERGAKFYTATNDMLRPYLVRVSLDLNRKRYCEISYQYKDWNNKLTGINYLAYEQGHYLGFKITTRLSWDYRYGWKL